MKFNKGKKFKIMQITDIQEISFQESGSMIPLVSYTTMTRENEGTRVQLELQYQYEYEKIWLFTRVIRSKATA